MNNLIKKIEIRSFRSIEKISIASKELNIISGPNDVGKSNVLKALNLFFNTQTDFLKSLNFKDDYNKVSRAKMVRSSKMKQLIRIRLYLNPPSSYKTLSTEKNVYIERQFDRNGDRSEKYSTDDKKKRTSINRIINKINYIYIPALKGENVIQYILSLIGERELITEADVQSLNTSITTNTEDLKDILEKSGVSIRTSFGFPTFLSDFWQKLSINTEYEQYEKLDSVISGSNSDRSLTPSHFTISLLCRGEGIKSKYIPPLLRWLDKNDKAKVYIWGIDEPENSLEFGLADKLARLFFNEYVQSNQIFLTTHSLAFINPPENTSVAPLILRVFKDELGRTQWKDINDILHTNNKFELLDELGVLIAQKEFIEEYRRVIIEREILKNRIKEYTKPIILVEGKTDKWIIEAAWGKLNPGIEKPFEIFPSGIYIDEDMSEGSADQVRRGIELVSAITQNLQIIIGLFDNDLEGNNQFKGLNEKVFQRYTLSSYMRKHKNKKIYGLLLPVPESRSDYVSSKIKHRFLEIEHYFSDDIIRRYKLNDDIIAPGSSLYRIRNKNKTEFAKDIVSVLTVDAFVNFTKLFDILNTIIT